LPSERDIQESGATGEMNFGMSKQVKFGEIDLEAIEYRCKYRHTGGMLLIVVTLFVIVWLIPIAIDDPVFWLLYLFSLIICAPPLLEYLQYIGSSVILTGQSLILKRPLFKDIEISYWEIDRVTLLVSTDQEVIITENYDSAIGLSKARQKMPADHYSELWIWPRGPMRRIIVEKSFENFNRFCHDLTERWRLSVDRYKGYAKGTSLRQPERTMKTWEAQKAQREEAMLRVHSSSEIQKAGATKSE
jgi:hypothetical protein